MRIAALLTALALSACAFSSEAPLFSDQDAVQPIANGAQYMWDAPDEAPQHVTFHRTGAAYELTERSHPGDTMTGVLLIPVPSTPEADYIVQWSPDSSRGEGRVYAFMWPVGETYRVYADPDTFEEARRQKPETAYCEERAYGECAFRTRQALLAYYQGVAYPALAARGATLESALLLTPSADAEKP